MENKELEALEIIGAEKLARGELIRNDDKLEPYVAILKQALTELKAIKEVNSSEALNKLYIIGHLEIGFDKDGKPITVKDGRGYPIIKQYILKAQELEKVLEIVKDKWVNVAVLIHSKTVDEYNNNAHTPYNLTEEEFNALKRW